LNKSTKKGAERMAGAAESKRQEFS
jgi:hypothetical protein